MAEQEQDKTEQATEHKIREAQKRGFVAKSAELNSFVMLSALLAILYFMGQSLVERQFRIDGAVFSAAGHVVFEVDTVWAWLARIVRATLSLFVPPALILGVCAILVNLIQSGPLFSFTPLKPDLDRINPASGFKRLFSLRLLMESAKSVLKVVLFGLVIYFTLRDFMPVLMGLSQRDPLGYPGTLLSLTIKLVAWLLVVLFFIAAIDWIFSRRDYQTKLRMSRRELREEIKHREGDPRIRARMRDLQKELLKRSKSLAKVKDADVLITNPTHLAIALVYRKDEMRAPQLVAKGAGEMASHLIALAHRHRVPVVRNKKLAAAMYRLVDLDETIPESLYPDVARVLIWIAKQRNSAHPALLERSI